VFPWSFDKKDIPIRSVLVSRANGVTFKKLQKPDDGDGNETTFDSKELRDKARDINDKLEDKLE
jgi:hypothetical protein